jgi:5'-3' exonuclease
MNQLFRAHYAHVELSTDDGYPTGAIYGFLEQILILQRHFADHPDIVICWEGDTALGKPVAAAPLSWRKVLAKGVYKANRTPNEETPRALSQLPKLHEILSVLGYLQVQVPCLEGDDVIGVAAATLCSLDKSVDQVFIFSGDQDFYQCITDRIQVLHPKPGKFVRMDARSVLQTHSVATTQWAKLKALAGDTTDNYKPIKGCGPKTAARYVKAGVDPSLPSFEMHPKPIQDAFPQLRAHWEKVHLCYRLAVIPTSWKYSEFPQESREHLREAIKQVVLHRRRRMTPTQIKQAMEKLTKLFGELQMTTFMGVRQSFFHGVKVL